MGQSVKIAAGTTLDPNQVVPTAATTDRAIGLLQENMDQTKIATGRAYGNVAIAGVAFGIAGAAIVAGARVMPAAATAGQLLTATTTNTVVGIALSAAGAQGDVFAVLLTPGANF